MNKKLKLNIICYGEHVFMDFKKVMDSMDNEIMEENNYDIEYLHAKDKESPWEYFIFDGEINAQKNEIIKNILTKHLESENISEADNKIKKISNEYKNDIDEMKKKISEVLSNYRKFYDILVIIVDKLLDEKSKFIFKFFQDISTQKNKQPFILFLTKKEEPKVDVLYQFITNEYYDKRNLEAFKFPSNNIEKNKIFNFFIKCMNYYHEISISKLNNSHSFNILVCGPAGVGKSSFINQFLEEKQAKEGEGVSVTHEITKYFHPKYPITIFDTPGFEDENTVNMVFNTIKKFDEEIKNTKNHLDFIIYYTQLKERTIYANETELIKYLLNSEKNIIFALNTFGLGKTSNKTKKLCGAYITSLKQIIFSLYNDKKIKKNNRRKKNIR